MVPHQNMNIIVECVIGPPKLRLRVITDSKEVSYCDLVNLLESRLPDVHTEIRYADAARKRSARRIFDLIAKVEIVQNPWTERVRLLEQRIVVVNICLVRIGKKVLKIQ